MMKNYSVYVILFFLSLIYLSCIGKEQKNRDMDYDKEVPLSTDHMDKKTVDTQSAETTNLIILGGGKTLLEAQQVKNQYLEDTTFNTVIKGEPVIVQSDTISGLNPGFFITAIGVETNVNQVKSIVKKAHTFWKGVYYRKVTLDQNQLSIWSKIELKSPCVYTELSDIYDFEVEVRSSKKEHNTFMISIVPIAKKNKNRYPMITVSATLFSSTFRTCGDEVSSFITGINTDEMGADYNYGDLVVADFNFDSKDDFAVRVAYGGSVGPTTYEFYEQTKKGHFKKEQFLSDIGVFPSKIDKNNEQLTIEYVTTRCTKTNLMYQYDKEVNGWIETKNYQEKLCDF